MGRDGSGDGASGKEAADAPAAAPLPPRRCGGEREPTAGRIDGAAGERDGGGSEGGPTGAGGGRGAADAEGVEGIHARQEAAAGVP